MVNTIARRLSTAWAALRDPATPRSVRLRLLLLAAAALVAAAVVVLAIRVLTLVPLAPTAQELRTAKVDHPAILRTADGQELAVFRRLNRAWVPLSRVSRHVVDALISAEDHRFYEHRGIDWRRTAAAVFHTATGDRQGGSTLTQQLARNLFPEEIGRSGTLRRKLLEAITARRMESVYGKQEILETYLNTVPFLYNAHGIEMAARTYFDKSAQQLDVLESATLVGMLKGTSYYNPVLNPDRARQRRNVVLQQMVKHGKLSSGRYEALRNRPLGLDFERQRQPVGPAPHFAEQVRKWLVDWADRNGHDMHADGLVVHTTLDSRLQRLAAGAVGRQADALQAVADVEWGRSTSEVLSTDPTAYVSRRSRVEPFAHFWKTRRGLLESFVRESKAFESAKSSGLDDGQALAKLTSDAAFMKALREEKTRLQAGFVAIDPANGHVKAWVGSRDFALDAFDHVQQARRQPGSTFKAFVYAAAFEDGMTLDTTVVDKEVAIELPNGDVWRPNEGERTSGEAVRLEDALAMSRNTITAQLVQQLGPGRVAELAHAMGVRQSPLEAVPSIALGTSPVTLLEMVSGYGTVANDGRYVEPVLVTRIENRQGQVLATFEPDTEQAISRTSAQALIASLRAAVDRGTATAIRDRFAIRADVAGKTGTTQNNADAWFILMHPRLVAGSWVGFNDGRVAMRSAYWGAGGHSALHLVGDFFQQALESQALDARARFAAPGSPGVEPILRDMGGWFERLLRRGERQRRELPRTDENDDQIG